MRRNLLCLFILPLLIAAGCSKSKTPGPIDTGTQKSFKLQIVSGNNQTAKVGVYPVENIKVKTTGDGFDHSKYYVEFRGSGCNADMPITYGILADGTAVASYRLAGNIGAQTLQATLFEISTKKRIDSVTFNFIGTAPTTGRNYTACTPVSPASSFTKTGTGRLFAIFGATYNNLRYSDDDGISWYPAKGLNIAYVVQKVRSDGKNQVVAYSYNQGVYYSADNGTTWTLQNESFKGISVDQLAYTPSGKLFFVAFDGSFYYSVDNGINWKTLTVEKGHGLLSPQEDPSGAFYVSATGKGIFKSIDEGVTWTKLPNITGSDYGDGAGDGFLVDPNNGWLYKSAGGGPSTLYLSKDGGNKYSPIVTTGLSSDLFIINNGILYFEDRGHIFKIDAANKFTEIVASSESLSTGEDFIVSNSGNVLFKANLSIFPEYVKP